MGRNFDDGVPGLQIDWEDDSEIEYFGEKVLVGQSEYTSAKCKVGGRTFRYRYPVRVVRETSALMVEYEHKPKEWPEDWGMYEGTLTIRFREAESVEPKTIEWFIRGESEPYVLESGKDWIFTDFSDVSSVNLKTRDRISVSRQMRPEQKEMRNKLISMYGGCQLTGVESLAALEACHIIPVKNGGDDSLSNSLLLRRDLHSLFDSGLLRFRQEDNAWKIDIDGAVRDEAYRALDGMRLPAEDLKIHSAHLKARENREPVNR